MKWSTDPTLCKRAQEMPTLDVLGPPEFEMPNVQDYASFQSQAMEMVKPCHGTTTLGFIYNGGVVVAVDSRATRGPDISSKTVDKFLPINDRMVGTMAGGAADCQFWISFVGMRCRLYELNTGQKITIRAASKILANIMYSYKNSGLSLGSMVAGYDRDGPGLYYVDNDGQRTAGQVFSIGSGSIYAYGVLDQGYKKDLTKEEACELARRAIFHAGHRDTASGGSVSVYHVSEEGWVKVSGDDVDDLHDLYYPPGKDIATQGNPVLE